ncbi:MAG: NupC/NupG family nucleoside CNT transporter [bacterium]|nr:NupC/NupG family nucleoside CNT transporter [bacterium]
MDFMTIFRGLIGILVIVGIALVFSNNRKKVSWKLVGIGLGIQMIFAIFIFHGKAMGEWFFLLGWPKLFIDWCGGAVIKILGFISEGSKFIFDSLAIAPGLEGSTGFYFAFQVLPTIIFFASLTAVLYHLGILQLIVKGMAKLMAKLLGTSGAETLSNTANVFIGQTEAPMLVRPYIGSMTQSELFTIMVGGMATVAGGVLASYVQMLGQAMAQAKGIEVTAAQAQFAVHLITASVMAAPASIVIAKILHPETQVPKTKGTVQVDVPKESSNVIEAAATGASEGLKLALNVGGMLIVFMAFIYMFNYILGSAGDLLGINASLQEEFGQPLSMQLILGLLLKYVAIGIGVPAQDALNFGSLFGTKVVLNEFVAYIDLTRMIKEGAMTAKGIYMATFALCGFANFASIAIQLGGIAPMAPHRKKDIAALGLKSVLGGGLVTLLTATLAGFLTS